MTPPWKPVPPVTRYRSKPNSGIGSANNEREEKMAALKLKGKSKLQARLAALKRRAKERDDDDDDEPKAKKKSAKVIDLKSHRRKKGGRVSAITSKKDREKLTAFDIDVFVTQDKDFGDGEVFEVVVGDPDDTNENVSVTMPSRADAIGWAAFLQKHIKHHAQILAENMAED